MKLALTAKYNVGETATSLFSRQADRNMCISARHHGRDLELPFQDVIHGMPDAIAQLEAFAGLDRGTLAPTTFVKDEGRDFLLNGQRLRSSSLQRTTPTACPRCLLEDMENGPHDPALNAFGRVTGEIVHIRTCRRHNVPYVVVGAATRPQHTHDFTLIFRENMHKVPALAEEAPHRGISDFEIYLEDRCMGRQEPAPWLDTLGFSAAAKACEVFGAVAEFGTKANLKTISTHDLARAGAAGFEILRHDAGHVREFLTSLQRRDEVNGLSGPQHAYGRIYQWLAFNGDDIDLVPIKDLVREHIVETMPVGAGEEVLGVAVTQRRLHSLLTAAKDHGVHPVTAAKVIMRSELAPSDALGLTDNQILLPAGPVDALMSRLARGITKKDIHPYLDISRAHLVHLLGSKYVKPIVEADDLEPLFDTADLDAFVASVTETAETVTLPTDDQVSLFEAVKRACCGVPEVQALLTSRELDWVGVLEAGRGYGAILVSLAEVKAKTELPPLQGVTADAIYSDLGVPQEAVHFLFRSGALPTVRAINPKNRCPVTIVPTEDYRAFKATYVSLRDLSRETKKWSRHLLPELAAKGVFPIPELETIGGYLFRRTDL